MYVEDTGGALLDPRALIRIQGAELCMFLRCAKAGATLTKIVCAEGVTARTNDNGDRGCCGAQVADIQSYECSTTNDDLNVDLVVRSKGAVCTEYTIEYTF